MESIESVNDLLAGLVVFSADGRAQFGWLNPATNQYCAEVDGRHISDAIGAIPWEAHCAH